MIFASSRLSSDLLQALRGFGVEYTGDMANPSGVGAIVEVIDDRWGQFVNITLEDGRRINRFHVGGMCVPSMRNGCAYRVILTGPAHGAPYFAQLEAAAAMREANQKAAADVGRRNFEASEAARVIDDAPRFMWNGIKDETGAPLQRAWYSSGELLRYPDGTITIYARDYGHFSAKVHACFKVKNDTDTMTDYFDKDTIRVIPSHPLYSQVKAAMALQDAHRAKRLARRA